MDSTDSPMIVIKESPTVARRTQLPTGEDSPIVANDDGHTFASKDSPTVASNDSHIFVNEDMVANQRTAVQLLVRTTLHL